MSDVIEQILEMKMENDRLVKEVERLKEEAEKAKVDFAAKLDGCGRSRSRLKTRIASLKKQVKWYKQQLGEEYSE